MEGVLPAMATTSASASFPRVERLVHALVIPPDDDSEQRHGEQRLARKAERAE